MPAQDILITLITVPSQEAAENLADALVSRRAAACVNIIPGISSVFSWEGSMEKEAELLLVVKTTESEFERLQSLVVQNHPYSCPEILAIPAAKGFEAYCQWVRDNTGS